MRDLATIEDTHDPDANGSSRMEISCRRCMEEVVESFPPTFARGPPLDNATWLLDLFRRQGGVRRTRRARADPLSSRSSHRMTYARSPAAPRWQAVRQLESRNRRRPLTTGPRSFRRARRCAEESRGGQRQRLRRVILGQNESDRGAARVEARGQDRDQLAGRMPGAARLGHLVVAGVLRRTRRRAGR